MIRIQLTIQCEFCGRGEEVRPPVEAENFAGHHTPGTIHFSSTGHLREAERQDMTHLFAPEGWSLSSGPDATACPACNEKNRSHSVLLSAREHVNDPDIKAALGRLIDELKTPAVKSV